MITIHFEYFVWCSWFVGLLSLLNFVPKSLFCGKARVASGPPGVRRNDPHQRCPGKIHHQKPRGQWSAKMEGCCSLSWTRKWMNNEHEQLYSCQELQSVAKTAIKCFDLLVTLAQVGGLEQPWTYTFRAVSLPNPMLEAPCPCGGKCGRTHADKLWHICITPSAKASTKATAATQHSISNNHKLWERRIGKQ